MTIRRILATVGLAFVLALPAVGATFEDCRAEIRQDPDGYASFQCLWIVGQNLNRYQEALAIVEQHLQVDPDHPWARLQALKLEWALDRPGAEEAFWQAAEAQAEQEGAPYFVDALVGVSSTFRNRGDLDDARRVLERGESYAAGLSPLSVARVRLFLGRVLEAQGDYTSARAQFESARGVVDREGSLDDRALLWGAYGNLAYRLGERAQALEFYGHAADAYRELGHVKNRLGQEINQVFCLAGMVQRNEAPVGELLSRAGALAAEAEANDLPRYALGAYQVLTDFAPPDDAMRYAESALRAAKLTEDVFRQIGAMESYGALLVEHGRDDDRRRGFGLIAEAIAAAESHGALPQAAALHRSHSSLARQFGTREQGVRASLAALDAFESIRNLQLDEDLRQRAFGYAMTSFALLEAFLVAEPAFAPGREDFELAFRTSERGRARTLLDYLESSGAYDPLIASDPLVAERNEVLIEIGRAQGRLAGPLADTERRDVLDALAALEEEERRLRRRLATRYEVFRPIEDFAIPSLAEVRQRLGRDEAIVSFQATDPAGIPGAVVVHTSDGSWARSLGSIDDLPALVHLWRGLIERRDGSEGLLARQLYDRLLAEALAPLPATVQRLVVVPDGVLHRLPFDALETPGTPGPLVVRYEVSTVPSVTLWHRWRGAEQPKPERSVLALGAPRLPAAGSAGDDERSLAALGRRFGELPFAAEEARRIVRRVGGESRVGSRANEASLKSSALQRYGVLHLAAHGVVDEEYPERSAVLLTAGANDEDGLLQPRDVIGLPLDGRLVVLSACRSATGRIVGGEGVLGLARGFLQAGAHAVVGSLWPVRDDETERLIDAFYEHLGRGETGARALALAKRDRRDAGAPAAAWAGMVFSGRGDILPLADDRNRRGPNPALGIVVILLLVVSAWVALRWRRARTAPS